MNMHAQFHNMTLAQKTMTLCQLLEHHRENIVKALSYGPGELTYDDVVARVLTGRYHVYPLPNSLMIMEFVEGEHTNVYHGVIAAGDLDEIASQHDAIDRVARELNCGKLVISGRRGWLKAFKPYGWTEQQTIIERPVPQEDD